MLRFLFSIFLVLFLINAHLFINEGRLFGNTEVIQNPEVIEIPALNITADIEAVGVDSEGNMDVPKDVENTAWYKLGYHVGEDGNAVIAGHYNNPEGEPAVFYGLLELSEGDEIKVRGDDDEEVVFEVVRVESYPTEQFPIEMVFGDSDEIMLNLITCSGFYSDTEESFTERAVVFAIKKN